MSNDSKFAVIVGIAQYEQPINSLIYTRKDAEALYEILIDPKRGGYPTDQIDLLIDEEDSKLMPTRSNIMFQINQITKFAEESNTILFNFSGHGMEEDGASYLLPADAKIGILRETAISLQWIKEKLSQSHAKAKIIILDSCHAGARLDKSTMGSMTQKFSEEISKFGEGFATLSSCKLNEVSYEWNEKEHGVFSYHLIEGLKGKADSNSDGRITIPEVSDYVTRKVKEWAFKNNKLQSPTLEYKVSGDILLVHVPKQISTQDLGKTDETEEASIISITLMKIDSVDIKDKEPAPDIDIDYGWTNPKADAYDKSQREAYQLSKNAAASICAKLLNYYNSDEITTCKEENYVFPDGTIVFGIVDSFENKQVFYRIVLKIEFSYARRTLIDKLMRELSKGEWNSLKFELNKSLDIGRLIELNKNSNMEIRSFDPSGKSPLIAIAPAWGTSDRPAIVSFHNSNGGSIIVIKQEQEDYRSYLESIFYEKINAKSIVEFLNPAFKK